PFVREKKPLKRPDHKTLHQDAMKHRHTASDDSSYSQSSVVPIHAHNPVLETATSAADIAKLARAYGHSAPGN
ncbi:MAG: hypothetical protein WBX35_26110, partial [Pseudolabrys sp.]